MCGDLNSATVCGGSQPEMLQSGKLNKAVDVYRCACSLACTGSHVSVWQLPCVRQVLCAHTSPWQVGWRVSTTECAYGRHRKVAQTLGTPML